MNEKIKDLIQIVKENPDLPIITATYWEVVSEDWGHWCGSINEIKVDYFYQKDEKWYAGEDEIKNEIYINHEEFKKNIDTENFSELVKEGKIKKSIIIYIGFPE